MNNCREYEGLISALHDKELDTEDTLRVEAHLKVCVACSNLHTIYRGISVSVSETCYQVPPHLTDNIMEMVRQTKSMTDIKLMSDDESSDESGSGFDVNFDNSYVKEAIKRDKRKKMTRLILTRYAPIAACLVIVLLALPQIFNFNRPYSEPEPVPEATMAMAMMDDYVDRTEPEIDAAELFTEGLSEVLPVEIAEEDLSPRENRFDSNFDSEAIGGQILNIDITLFTTERVIENGFFAFLVVDMQLPDAVQVFEHGYGFFLINREDVLLLISDFNDNITTFVPGDENAEFALIMFE